MRAASAISCDDMTAMTTDNAPNNDNDLAPELSVSQWFNCDQPVTLAGLRSKVVLIHAFQMLCQGCVMAATPQAARVWLYYRQSAQRDRVAVIGLHTVFEHHHVMTPAALQVYLHEFRVPFPVGVDQPGGDDPIPVTMRAFRMQGTPTTLLIDRAGRLRKQHFGVDSDQALIREIDALILE